MFRKASGVVLGLALLGFVGALGALAVDAGPGVSDDVAATVTGGQTTNCFGVSIDYGTYACGGPCAYGGGSSCPKIYGRKPDPWGNETAQTLYQYYISCYTCTCGQTCGGGTILVPYGCAGPAPAP
jgi:hypothetical protein